MRIRSVFLAKVAGVLAAGLLRLWLGTLRYRVRFADPKVNPNDPNHGGSYIYAFWHDMMLLPLYTHGRRGMHMLVSRHQDGEYLAQVARAFRMGVIRGSTARGGTGAARQLMRQSRLSALKLAFTPDGPRGPRRQVQPGLIYLASRTGIPIVPAGLASRRPWRLRSWDRFALPKPFSVGVVLVGKPICIPADLDRPHLEQYRKQVEQALHELTDQAEHWSEGGAYSDLQQMTG